MQYRKIKGKNGKDCFVRCCSAVQYFIFVSCFGAIEELKFFILLFSVCNARWMFALWRYGSIVAVIVVIAYFFIEILVARYCLR